MRVDQTRSSATSNSGVASETSSAKKSGRAALIEEGRKAQAAKSARVASEGDAKSEISPRAREFAAAKAIASQTPDVREEKVAALKRRIAEGKYQVDAAKVADRMVDEHLSSHLD